MAIPAQPPQQQWTAAISSVPAVAAASSYSHPHAQSWQPVPALAAHPSPHNAQHTVSYNAPLHPIHASASYPPQLQNVPPQQRAEQPQQHAWKRPRVEGQSYPESSLAQYHPAAAATAAPSWNVRPAQPAHPPQFPPSRQEFRQQRDHAPLVHAGMTSLTVGAHAAVNSYHTHPVHPVVKSESVTVAAASSSTFCDLETNDDDALWQALDDVESRLQPAVASGTTGAAAASAAFDSEHSAAWEQQPHQQQQAQADELSRPAFDSESEEEVEEEIAEADTQDQIAKLELEHAAFSLTQGGFPAPTSAAFASSFVPQQSTFDGAAHHRSPDEQNEGEYDEEAGENEEDGADEPLAAEGDDTAMDGPGPNEAKHDVFSLATGHELAPAQQPYRADLASPQPMQLDTPPSPLKPKLEFRPPSALASPLPPRHPTPRLDQQGNANAMASTGMLLDAPHVAAASSSSFAAPAAAAGASSAAASSAVSWTCGDPSAPALSLSRYVPAFLVDAYRVEMGIESLYPWQAECLECGDGRALNAQGNLVYSAPTSGGKTLVAELLMLRYQIQFNLFRSHSALARSSGPLPVAFRSLFVVPFNALVQEKARDLHAIVGTMYLHIQTAERAAFAAASRSSNGRAAVFPDDDAPQIHIKALDNISDFSSSSPILIGVVTLEKASMILTHLIAERRMDELGCVILDECHMLGDQTRGFLLEHVITKLLYIHEHRVSRRAQTDNGNSHSAAAATASSSSSVLLPGLQIIGLSATLPNIHSLCSTLYADFFQTTFRPVELSERFAILETVTPQNPGAIGVSLYNAEEQRVRKSFVPAFQVLTTPQVNAEGKRMPALDSSLLSGICYNLWSTSGSSGSTANAIVFCSSKRKCVEWARTVARSLAALKSQGMMSARESDAALDRDRSKLLESLKSSHFGLDPVLALTVPQGVAFHHAGLSFTERTLIESAYRAGTLFVLMATTTLACGVNIGAAKVIFTSLQTGMEAMGPATYKQCSGRAGRAGKQEFGESIILLSADTYNNQPVPPQQHRDRCLKIMNAPIPPLISCLDQVDSAEVCRIPSDPAGAPLTYVPYLARLLLDSICAQLTRFPSEIAFMMSLTLLQKQREAAGVRPGVKSVEDLTRETLEWLRVRDFINWERNVSGLCCTRPPFDVPPFLWRASALGQATTVSALSPKDATIVHRHLSAARSRFILESGLHALFLITPLHVNITLDWSLFAEMLESLSELNQRVASVVGVDANVVRCWANSPPSSSVKQSLAYHTAQRFFYTLVLHEYLQCEDMELIELSVTVDKGVLQQLSESARSFGHMMTNFCMKLQWLELALMLKQCVNERFDTDFRQPQQPTGGSSLDVNPSRPLPELTRLRPAMANSLYQHGMTSLRKIDDTSLDDLSRILRACRGHVLQPANATEESMEHQAEMIKRQAARILREQQAADAKEKQRQAANRERVRLLRQGTTKPAAGPASTTSPASSAAPLLTPQSQYHPAQLIRQLKSPGATAATSPASPSVAPPAAADSAALPAVASASSSTLIKNVSEWSYDEWTQWRESWAGHKMMFWQFYGIRRTHEEDKARQRVHAQATGGGGPLDLDDGSFATGVDGLGLDQSQAEAEDLLLSPHCRTFFNAAHFHLYPLRLRNIAGIVLSFDHDTTVFDLRVGDKYNSVNPEGVGGQEMWEAFCFALLEPSLQSICINVKVHLQILNSLPMPPKVVQRVFETARETHSIAAGSSSSTVAPLHPSSASFLVLLYLASSRSVPLRMLDVRVAHWLLYPGQKELLQLETYYNWYTNPQLQASSAASANDAIPCSPDVRTNQGFDMKKMLQRQQASLLRFNPYAPDEVKLPDVKDAPWQQASYDRFRFATDAAGAARSLALLLPLHLRLMHRLSSAHLLPTFLAVEVPLSAALAHIEFLGMGFHASFLSRHISLIRQRLRYLQFQARLFLHEDLDLDSPKTYIAAMQEQLDIPLPGWFMRQIQERSVGARKGQYRDIPKLLEELAAAGHAFPAIIQELRKLRLSLSHFDTLPNKAINNRHLGMARIHPTLLQNTHTGRLSCQDPNVQSISKELTYKTAPYYSVHEEISKGALTCVPGNATPDGKAQISVRRSAAEKRVAAEREAARKLEVQSLMSKNRTSPQQKKRLAELTRPPPNTLMRVMVLHPNKTLDYGLLGDIRSETIADAFLVPNAGANRQGLAPLLEDYSTAGTSLAAWWEAASQGHCRWDAAERSVMRIAVVGLFTGQNKPTSWAFFPVDQVWRSEAYVPWELDSPKSTGATENSMMDVPAAAPSSTSAAPAASSSAAAVPSTSVCSSSAPDATPRSQSQSHTFSVRDSFVAASGYVLLSVDYSNIELRMMAHFSKDVTLMGLFNQQVDVLTAMGAKLFKVEYERVDAAQRATAKSCVYAILYGAGEGKVAEDVSHASGEGVLRESDALPCTDAVIGVVVCVCFPERHQFVRRFSLPERVSQDLPIDSQRHASHGNAGGEGWICVHAVQSKEVSDERETRQKGDHARSRRLG